MSADAKTSYFVEFECGHTARLLPDEYGDGSAWCIECEQFKCYDVALASMMHQERVGK